MGHFTPVVIFTTEFDGDQITFKMRRLLRRHVVKLAPHVSQNGETLSFSGQMELMDIAAKIVPDVVESMTGLVIEGRDGTINEVLDEAYFAPLLGNLLVEMLRHCSAGNAEKNSGGQSAA